MDFRDGWEKSISILYCTLLSWCWEWKLTHTQKKTNKTSAKHYCFIVGTWDSLRQPVFHHIYHSTIYFIFSRLCTERRKDLRTKFENQRYAVIFSGAIICTSCYSLAPFSHRTVLCCLSPTLMLLGILSKAEHIISRNSIRIEWNLNVNVLAECCWLEKANLCAFPLFSPFWWRWL